MQALTPVTTAPALPAADKLPQRPPSIVPNPADVSSLLSLVQPNTANPHMQWYQKNYGAVQSAGAKDAVAAPVDAFWQAMDMPLPELPDKQVRYCNDTVVC